MPLGAGGGLPGRPGAITINPRQADEQRPPAHTADIIVKPGDVLRLETGGGGGVGDPSLRQRYRILTSLEDTTSPQPRAGRYTGYPKAAGEETIPQT